MSYMVSQMKDMGLGSLSPFQQMQQGFHSTMQDIQNDPFPLLEQYLGRQAKSNIDQTLQPMQQQAQEKISGVMSGIRSLVSEAFPSGGGGGGMSTTGQLGSGTVGGGFNPPNQITQPTSPAPFVSESVTQPTGPSPSTPLSGDPTAPLLGGGGFNPDGGVPVTGLGGPMMDIISAQKSALGEKPPLSFDNSIAEQKYFGDQLMGESIKEGGVDPSSVGLGGNPEIFQPPMTDPTTISPALTDPPMLPKIADFGPVSATIDPATLDPSNPASPAYNPAMEYHDPAFPMPQLPQQDPLINLAYNYNMENSPF